MNINTFVIAILIAVAAGGCASAPETSRPPQSVFDKIEGSLRMGSRDSGLGAIQWCYRRHNVFYRFDSSAIAYGAWAGTYDVDGRFRPDYHCGGRPE